MQNFFLNHFQIQVHEDNIIQLVKLHCLTKIQQQGLWH